VKVTPGADLTVDDVRYLKLIDTFDRSSSDGNNDGTNAGPIRFDVSVQALLEWCAWMTQHIPARGNIWSPGGVVRMGG
jgi:hypothetical protein